VWSELRDQVPSQNTSKHSVRPLVYYLVTYLLITSTTALAKSHTRALIAPRLSPTHPVGTIIESDTTATCSPGGTTVTRAERTDFFDYLLDSRRSDLLHFLQDIGSHVFIRSSILIFMDHSTRYHRIYILTALTPHKKYSHVPHCIANNAISLFFPFPLSLPSFVFSYACSLLMGFTWATCVSVPRCTVFFLRFSSWVHRCDPLKCRSVTVADLLSVYFM